MRRAFLGLGSNVDRRSAIRESLASLESRFGAVRRSAVYECPAVGFDGPPFFNLVVEVYGEESPQTIDRAVRDIEDELGRTRDGNQFSDRRIDIDLLMVGHLVLRDGSVRLPRSDVSKYAFVLRPIAELAPEFIHPVLGLSLGALWTAMSASGDSGGLSEVAL